MFQILEKTSFPGCPSWKSGNGSYTFTDYGPDEICNLPFSREMRVCEIFDPPSRSIIIKQNIINQCRLDTAESEAERLYQRRDSKNNELNTNFQIYMRQS